MLDIKFIRENLDQVKEKLSTKKVGIEEKLDKALKLDSEKKELQQEIEALRGEQKKLGKEDIEKATGIKRMLKDLEPRFNETSEALIEILSELPNIPSDDTPIGKSEDDNKVLKQVGEIPKFNFQPKEHWQLGEDLGLLDFERAVKVSGSRFAYIKGELALLQFALVQFAYSILTSEAKLKEIADEAGLDVSTKPFLPIVPPVLVKEDIMRSMARLEPRDERYFVPSDGLFLVGSAEHALGPMHMDETLKEEDLPVRYAGMSPAFRREAGSYGKDMKGLIRLHQFDKLEMESFTLAENSTEEQNFIVAIQEYLMTSLGLSYQIVLKCTADQGDPDVRAIDIETWLPGQNKYRETHTSDLMTDYQSRRLNTRIKKKDGQVEYAHMNDATAFAIGRTLVAIMENYQQEDGSIKVPEILQKYIGFKEIRKNI